MLTIDQIKTPIASYIEEFEKHFRASMKSPVPLLNTITRYIIKRKGKQMRPMFVFFSAKVCGEVNQSTFHAASLIELLHTATLIHDDVVDDSNERRGFFSLNALWKNKIAVLVGDYLLSRGLLLSLEYEEYHLLKIVSNATREMSEGELLQIEKARKLDIEEPVYFEIIRKKTASLIASCCAAGAASVGADAETIEKMRLFGEYVGIAFQIKDDLFDYEQSEKTGKPRGIDIKEHKMTLPVIYTLQNVASDKKNFIINTIKHHSEDATRVEEVIRTVLANGGLDYARKAMYSYQQKAFDLLEGIPDSNYKESLINLVKFTTERNH